MPRRPIRLPKQWSKHVKSSVLRAIALASVAVSYARGRATEDRRLKAQLDQATAENALLREELNIKDSRWARTAAVWLLRRAGEPASICIVERFIRSMKQECTRRLLVPLSHATLRRELRAYGTWYNNSRPHMHLFGRTPREALENRPAPRRRFETQPRMRSDGALRCNGLALVVDHLEGRAHLPVVELRRAA